MKARLVEDLAIEVANHPSIPESKKLDAQILAMKAVHDKVEKDVVVTALRELLVSY